MSEARERILILRKKIAIFTGTRAEYGLLYWLIKAVEDDADLVLRLIVSGTHLSPEFGLTVNQIEKDGFHICEKVEMLVSSSTTVGVAKSVGLGVIGFADALNRIGPDCIFILGDRFEALAVAQTAMMLQIPIAHLHGGELTEGLIDESIRHSITKMSHLHFTSAEIYRDRVLQLGENPSRVFNVGAPAIENIRRLKVMSKQEIEESLGFVLGDSPFLVTYHPVTLYKDGGVESLKNLLAALVTYFNYHKVVITFPNADAFGRDIIDIIKSFSEQYQDHVIFCESLGQVRYLSLMSISSVVIGNSSSGLLEAPGFRVPTVDIGDRQKGRIKPGSVIESSGDRASIINAIDEAISDKHIEKCSRINNPYGDGYVSKKIVDIVKKIDIGSLLHKSFYDLENK